MLCIQVAIWAECHPLAVHLLVCKCRVDIKISLHTIYGYAVMQLCSFKMRGVKRDEKNFIIYILSIIIYIITIYLVRKALKIGKRAKNNCITV